MHTHRLTIDEHVVRKRFISSEDSEPDREWAGLVALARDVPGLAPTPLYRTTEAGDPVIVMSRVPGVPLGDEPLTSAQVRALAAALRQLFAAPADRDTPERAAGPSVMRSLVRQWAAHPYELALCADPELVRTALDLSREWLANDRPAIDRIADPVLAVADGNLNNLLWDGERCRLIDFEEFGVSDLAYEVADIIEHASSRLGRLLDVDALLRELILSEDQRLRLLAFRQLFATFWLVMLLPGNGGFTRNPPGSTEDQARHVLALLNA